MRDREITAVARERQPVVSPAFLLRKLLNRRANQTVVQLRRKAIGHKNLVIQRVGHRMPVPTAT
jgi:hypothetical protein